MPLIATRGAASASGFGLFSAVGGLGGGHWIGTLGGTGQSQGYSVSVDGSGNAYFFGSSNASGTNSFELAKYNSLGTIQWQKRLTGGTDSTGLSVYVDSSGNSYICGYSDGNPSGSYAIQFAKYDTSGNVSWQRYLTGGGAGAYGSAITADSSGNVYVCGNGTNTGYAAAQIAKYNSSGTVQWQRRLDLSASSIDTPVNSIAVDSSANVYICGYYLNSGTQDIYLAKYNTSGTLQWQRRLGGTGDQIGLGISADSSGNVYITGYTVGATVSSVVAKYDTSGAIQWQQTLTGSGSEQGYSVTVDSSGNVYFCGRNTTTSNAFLIAKYNTSGVLQWQRILSGGDAYGRGIAVDSSNNYYICGYSDQRSGNNDFLFAKLPTDGTKTGTYVVGGYSYNYATSSLTDATSSLTAATSALTASSSAMTAGTTTMTEATSTLTSSVTL